MVIFQLVSWRSGLLSVACGRVVAAQIYTFDHAKAPERLELTSHFLFYVYGYRDAPRLSYALPRASLPRASFRNFSVRCGAKVYRDGACQYPGIQVTLMRYIDFKAVVNPKNFCCSGDGLDDNGDFVCTANNLFLQNVTSQPGFKLETISTIPDQHEVYVYSVRGYHDSIDHLFPIRDTGMYVLMVSNCGYEEDSVTLSGTVVVESFYGFLPGKEYPRKAFNGWLAMAYVVLTCAWAWLMVAWRAELFGIHACFVATSAAAAARAIGWWVLLQDWNSVGRRCDNLLSVVMATEGIYVALSTFLLLSASLGWGITLPLLPRQLVLKLVAASAVYGAMSSAVLDAVKLISLRCVELVLKLCILCFACWALSQQTRALANPRQIAKLRLFKHVERILCFLFLAPGALQAIDLALNSWDNWQTEWIRKDALPRFLEAFVLMLMMYLWAPCNYNKHYAPGQPAAEMSLQDEMQQFGFTNVGVRRRT